MEGQVDDLTEQLGASHISTADNVEAVNDGGASQQQDRNAEGDSVCCSYSSVGLYRKPVPISDILKNRYQSDDDIRKTKKYRLSITTYRKYRKSVRFYRA